MNKETFCEAERRRLEKLKKFQLPNRYKKIGISIVVLSFLLMIVKKFIDEPFWVKPVLSNAFLFGFLIISVAKEKIEDELVVSIRSQSYRLAFVIGVAYSIIQPFINYGVKILLNPEKASIEMSSFQVLTFMLLIQLAFFESLKRYR